MLRKFSVCNYRNFGDEVELDLTKRRDYTFCPRCITDNIISKAVLMGRNACGKTNLAHALFDITCTLSDMPSQDNPVEDSGFVNGKGAARFRYEFQNGEKVLVYEYGKTSPKRIVSECFTIDGEVVFSLDHVSGERNLNGLNRIDAESLDPSGFDGSVPALRYIITNTNQKEGSPLIFLRKFVNGMLYLGTSVPEPRIIGCGKSAPSTGQYIIENGLIEMFQTFINECGMDMRIGIGHGTSGAQIVQKIRGRELPFDVVASDGAYMLEQHFFWSRCFPEATMVFVDDFGMHWRFDLARKLLSEAISTVDAQVIFTTQNTALVDNDLLRPDCYLLLEKGIIASFADRTERELRMAHNLEKMLRSGEFD